MASKQSEIGIGQTAFTESYFEQVDFLPPMTYQELIISQRKPNEIVSFTTLIYPLDNYVWAFTLFSSAVMFIALMLVKKVGILIKVKPSLMETITEVKKSDNSRAQQ